jgi:8-oxo-dGTP pyrophosphatase MutT (NUDIX family)
MSDKNNWQTLHIEEVYDNPWIQVTHRDVINPSGGKGIYGKVHFKNLAIGIVPIDEEEHTWLVGQYRYTLDAYSWEIPEGGCPLGTSPIAAAQRELLEETGIVAKQWTPLLSMHISNSVSDEYGHVFVAQNLTVGVAEPEETEELQLIRIPLIDAFQKVMNGEITDSLSMVALMKCMLWKQEGRL